MNDVLASLGLTIPQAITAIPIFITLASLMYKLIKVPFKMIDIISVNKYVSLPVKDKAEAMRIIYEGEVKDKSIRYINELKLAEYGLHYPILTLRVMFDYLHSERLLSVSSRANDFLKYHKVFFIDGSNNPHISKKGMSITIFMLSMLMIISIGGFVIGIKALIETLHKSPDVASGIQLVIYILSEILFVLMTLTMLTELSSVYQATSFAKKMRGYNSEEIFKKYKEGLK
ncbi:hypothetical protein [Pantoea septica]|uniref:hypothetical protein n=1 Tax=Pantoea septica TaxID=472695 RepID=UPI00053500E1|nr:hypothetical protein [Pantoea septica]